MSAQSGTEIIQGILLKIERREQEDLCASLNRLPLTVLASGRSEKLLVCLLTQCAKYLNVEAARAIISSFNDARIRVDPLPCLTLLLVNAAIPRELVLFLTSCFPEKQPIDYYIDVINMHQANSDALSLKAAINISSLFPEIPLEDWQTLVTLTESDSEDDPYPNQALREFFLSKVSQIDANRDRPHWIQDIASTQALHPLPDILPGVKEAVDLILNNLTPGTVFDSQGRPINDKNSTQVRDALISQYSISTTRERVMLLSTLKNFSLRDLESVDDKHLFREFGPVNTIYSPTGQDEVSENICSKYGGCRMLLCNEFEQVDCEGETIDLFAIEEHTFSTDWFRKSCDKCHRRISKRHYAVRQPLLHGGWMGCFCSIACMKKDVMDKHVVVMISRVEEQLGSIGIRERE